MKFHCIADNKEIVAQHVVGGSGGMLQTGDSVKMKHTAWIIEKSVVGRVGMIYRNYL